MTTDKVEAVTFRHTVTTDRLTTLYKTWAYYCCVLS